MRKVFIFTMWVLLLPVAGFSQIIGADVQYVTISDSSLLEAIDIVIAEESKRDSIFAKGFGYFMMYYNGWSEFGIDNLPESRVDTLYTYHIDIAYGDPRDLLIIHFPNYYSEYRGRILAFHPKGFSEPIAEFTPASKERYLDKLNKNLFNDMSKIGGAVEIDYHYSVQKLRRLPKSFRFTDLLVLRKSNLVPIKRDDEDEQ